MGQWFLHPAVLTSTSGFFKSNTAKNLAKKGDVCVWKLNTWMKEDHSWCQVRGLLLIENESRSGWGCALSSVLCVLKTGVERAEAVRLNRISVMIKGNKYNWPLLISARSESWMRPNLNCCLTSLKIRYIKSTHIWERYLYVSFHVGVLLLEAFLLSNFCYPGL